MHKYNYVVVGGPGFYEVAYNDLTSLPNVLYYKSFVDGIQSPLMRLLTKINFNLKINKYIKTPFKKFVFPQLLPSEFNDNKPLCFLFFNLHFAVINTEYIDYLRKTNPNAKFVLYMHDIVSSLQYYDIDEYKRKFDLVISYDQGDCDEYGLEYFPTPYSKLPLSEIPPQTSVDVYFCGKAKNRYTEIIDAYNICKSNGLSCRFYIHSAPEKDRLISDDIIYDKSISYIENLSNVISCRCVLEIMQKGAQGFTPRLWEALLYDKHLLTNNTSIKDSKYFNPTQIHLTDNMEDIKGWIYGKTPKSDFEEDKSPLKLIDFIESKLKD